jgi:predicted XRE-type DNA-binding protein
VDLLLESDIIHFQVGTAVNVAHQDPALPVELDIRRNIIKRIAALLEQKHLKQVLISYY